MATQRVRSVPITSYSPDRRNANKGTIRGEAMLERSLQQLGAGRSILADKHGNLIAGNKTYGKAGELGLKVIEVETDGTELVVVKRTDLDLYSDTDSRARQLAYADNRIQELDFQLDPAILQQDIKNESLDLKWMYNTLEMEQFLRINRVEELKNQSDDEKEVDPREQEREALLLKWDVHFGDLWQIGDHRLMCGDSTNPEYVDLLLGNALPNLMVTDPPYGVSYDASWRDEEYPGEGMKGPTRRIGKVDNDDRSDWTSAYALFPGNVAYIWHASTELALLQSNIESCDFEIRNQIVWVKTQPIISRGHYNWQHESCLYAVRHGKTASWIGDHSQSTVWEIGKDDTIEGSHSTQKPLECMMRPLINHAGDVYDPFCGTGTIIVAAHKMGVRSYCMELKPEWVAVTLQRLSDMGLETKRLIQGDQGENER